MDNQSQPLDADLQPGANQPHGLRISQTIRRYWYESSRWAFFFAVLGFLYLGLVLLIFSTASSKLGAAGLPVVLVLLFVGALVFPPVWFIFQFAQNIQKALRHEDNQAAAVGFQNLRRLYQFIGVLTAILLGFYGITLIFTFLFMATAG
ncbi:MAG: hypothetical protein IPM98_04155 [Lewinellaceae bacterium]|nr:hypothetical protein [Lewinellaceae bacterium]